MSRCSSGSHVLLDLQMSRGVRSAAASALSSHRLSVNSFFSQCFIVFIQIVFQLHVLANRPFRSVVCFLAAWYLEMVLDDFGCFC